jgi:hypothetical protein
VSNSEKDNEIIVAGDVPDIVVAGDVTIDWLQWTTKYNGNFKSSPNWTLYPGTRMKAEKGGALLLAKMVEEATKAQIYTHFLENIENIPPNSVIHSMAILDTFPLSKKDKNECKNKNNKIFRIRHHGGFCGPINENSRLLRIIDDIDDANMVILDDAGNGFREKKCLWPKAILKYGKHPIIILKMSQPLSHGVLWDHIVKEHSENLILIIDAKDLRKLGVNISRRLSWEQTAEDFCWQLANNPEINSIAGCKNVIVRFGLEGTIHYTNCNNKTNAILYYDPNFGEDGYKEQYEGDMQGLTAAFVAEFAAKVAGEGLAGIDKGIFGGMQKSRKLLRIGFGSTAKDPSYPISKLFEPNNEKDTIYKVAIPDFKDAASDKNNKWRILEECTRGELESISCKTVKNEIEERLKKVPSARFGNLFTLDREEIESFQSIKNLMCEYLERTEVNVPLSIAVFGSPGSGKSFGVTELALSLDQKRIEKIEFNVSQFTSISDLASAFHKVRDLVLKGKMPLVFFDEFDAFFDGKLGWLKYFLAPMQDGMFKDGETMHPIGRSIFVFAGGTSHTFQQFSREQPYEMTKDEKGEEKKEERKEMKEEERKKKIQRNKILREFNDAKGTDFISRLRGYVNIMGVNRTGPEDSFFIIRRALLFRALLSKKVPQIFDDQRVACIDSGVLRAFLRVPAYKHGARSMEAIIDMSTLAGRRRFTQEALPPSKQLEMHVNSEIFLKLMLRDVLYKSAMECLAKEIHEQYRIDQQKNKNSDDLSMQPWEKLRDDLKNSNRKQAEEIPEKLRRIGFDFVPYLQKPEKPLRFSEEQIEFLAEMEHERWVDERNKEGWEFGSPRDPEKKISPYLIPWSDPNLTEEVKEWDRNAVKKIPELLEKAGFEVYPLQ